jgi:hypothetical protein
VDVAVVAAQISFAMALYKTILSRRPALYPRTMRLKLLARGIPLRVADTATVAEREVTLKRWALQ